MVLVRYWNGAQVLEFRKFFQMTQSELAHELGVSVTTISRWENGKPISRFGKLVLSDYAEKLYYYKHSIG